MATFQKPIRLDQPIDENAPPTIYSSSLTPELSNAALNLAIDFQRQKQSTANQHIIRHPITVSIIIVALSVFSYVQVGDAVINGGLVALKYQTDKLFQILIFLAMTTSIVLTVFTKPTEIIKTRADSLVDDSTPVFGFDLKEFVKANKNSKDKKTRELLEKGQNSTIVVYRDSPIALITLSPSVPERDVFVVKITGVGIRKVYQKSGIIDDLFDYAIKRATELNNQNKKPFSKILLLIQVLSTDDELKKTLTNREFIYIEKQLLSDSKILSLYGVYNEIWGLALNVSKVSDIKEKSGTTGFKKH